MHILSNQHGIKYVNAINIKYKMSEYDNWIYDVNKINLNETQKNEYNDKYGIGDKYFSN